ncbi:MAG: dihydrofolate reductase family protein [Aggregatilineales bacterium]
MAKLIYLMQTSLDGYVEDAQGDFGWTAPDKEINGYINDFTSSIGTYLYGRNMYDSMVFWEKDYADHDLPQFSLDYARIWQAAEKIVYSSTLAEPRSVWTRIEREFDPDAVRRLKADAERDISINGPGLAAHALRAGLVDEVRLFIHPIIVGGGKRFFPDGVRSKLELIEERAFSNEIVAVRYAVRG